MLAADPANRARSMDEVLAMLGEPGHTIPPTDRPVTVLPYPAAAATPVATPAATAPAIPPTAATTIPPVAQPRRDRAAIEELAGRRRW